ncbi:hypothetical protein [Enterobacter roggenkampii]|uniref:hypothetical protein n=1 Tax=Enterobacter roggenkampii TaxID=1812935 RepID=UPI002074DA7F|nr:hypothetical protein [Enterobacter roggenkampii]MCM6993508.1 hypothetical protein [Enterobacter roggenkampii]
MSNIDKQALNQEKIEWLNKLADMEYCKSNPGHWLMSLKDTNMLAKLALRSVALLDELEPMALAHLNLNLLCDVYRTAYEEARHDGLVNWEAAASLTEENGDLKRKLEASEKLNAELMEKQRLIDICQGQGLEHRIAAEKRAEAAEKRIAELEAREVVLPSTQDVHPLGPQSAKIFWEFHRSIVNRCADEIRKVGVKVSIKGN